MKENEMTLKLSPHKWSPSEKGEPAFKNETADVDPREELLLESFRQLDLRDQDAVLTLTTALARQYGSEGCEDGL